MNVHWCMQKKPFIGVIAVIVAITLTFLEHAPGVIYILVVISTMNDVFLCLLTSIETLQYTIMSELLSIPETSAGANQYW